MSQFQPTPSTTSYPRQRGLATAWWLLLGVMLSSNSLAVTPRLKLHFASLEEGRKHLQTADEYTRSMSPFDRAARLQVDRDVAPDEYLHATATHVLAWTVNDQQRIEALWHTIADSLAPKGLSFPDQILLILTDGQDEGQAASTRGHAILVPQGKLAVDDKALTRLFFHELFHILSRHNPDLRSRLYTAIGFIPCPPVDIPASLSARVITNPDAPYYDHCIRVKHNQQSIWCMPILYSRTPRYDPAVGGTFFDYMEFRFLVVPGPGTRAGASPAGATTEPLLLRVDELAGFYDQIGRNTQYIIHPEEIIAENFALLFTDPQSAQSPEILADIERQLTTQPNDEPPQPIAEWLPKATSFGGDGPTQVETRSLELQSHAHREYSISAWIQVDEAALPQGDILSRYDPAQRRGFYLGVINNLAATSGAANAHHLAFGIDQAEAASAWVDCGRPGHAVLVFSLCAHANQLFASTCEADGDQTGKVFRYDGGQQWIDCGCPCASNAVTSLGVYHGKLYAGTGKYRLRGSALPDTTNSRDGGAVFRYEDDGQWVACGQLPQVEAINGMVVFRDRLYVSSTYSPGVYRYEPTASAEGTWVPIGTPGGRRVEALTVFHDALWGGGYDAGEIYRYTPDTGWNVVGSLPDTTQTYGFAVYGGQLYVGTWPQGKVYRYEQDNDWIDCGQLGSEKEVMAIAGYNGQLYAGTLPLAQVYRYERPTTWTPIGQLDSTPDVKYRRVWTMAMHRGQLFAGTLPSGHVKSWQAGACAMSTQPLTSGWHHVVGVRGKNQLQLYLNGILHQESAISETIVDETRIATPVHLATGPHDHFQGTLRDVRLYNKALSPTQVKQTFSSPPKLLK